MANLNLILTILAFLPCALAGFSVGHPRLHLGWLGVACFVLATLI